MFRPPRIAWTQGRLTHKVALHIKDEFPTRQLLRCELRVDRGIVIQRTPTHRVYPLPLAPR
ncbi:hypothetical protein NKDENANG_03363 [Candidatus Entotheonellaceae bacterium PAL068K]